MQQRERLPSSRPPSPRALLCTARPCRSQHRVRLRFQHKHKPEDGEKIVQMRLPSPRTRGLVDGVGGGVDEAQHFVGGTRDERVPHRGALVGVDVPPRPPQRRHLGQACREQWCGTVARQLSARAWAEQGALMTRRTRCSCSAGTAKERILLHWLLHTARHSMAWLDAAPHQTLHKRCAAHSSKQAVGARSRSPRQRTGRDLRRSGRTMELGETPMPCPRMCSMRYSRSAATSRCWTCAESQGRAGVGSGRAGYGRTEDPARRGRSGAPCLFHAVRAGRELRRTI